MPELPEVETVRRALAAVLPGLRLGAFSATVDRLRTPLDLPGLARRCRGRRVVAVRRRAKFLLVETEGPAALVIHLGMTGSLRVVGAGTAREPHDRVAVRLSGGLELRLRDPRRFGRVEAYPLPGPGADPPALAGLGPEPLEAGFDGARLFAWTRRRRAPIKALLLDQRAVVGVGNIYASEALHRACIRPARAGGSLRRRECDALAAAIREVLVEALAWGGTTLVDEPGGKSGRFREQLRVYGREGEPCRRDGCPGRIRRTVLAGRSAFWCPCCQGGRPARRTDGLA